MDIVDPELIERLGQAEEEQTDEVNEDEDELGEPAEEQEGGTWGGWFSRLNTESIAKIAADAIATVKRDIDEFKNAVAVDSATVVDSVESSLPELAAKVSTQIDGVGENIESYGHSIFTGTTELFTQASVFARCHGPRCTVRPMNALVQPDSRACSPLGCESKSKS